MSAEIIDGKKVAESILAAVKTRTETFSPAPQLVAVAVGSDKASESYTKRQAKVAQGLGIRYRLDTLPAETTESDLRAHLARLDADPDVTGVILQTPLPKAFDVARCRDVLSAEKDVEGVTTAAAGRLATNRPAAKPCTAHAAFVCLVHALGGDVKKMRGLEVAVVGRSEIVGKPLALMLIAADATVTVCHRGTKDLGQVLRRADAVIAAAGAAKLVRAEMIRPGTIVIDVGTNPVTTPEGTKIVGDVDFDAVKEVARAITPVPGGVGQVTTALLMQNVLDLADQAKAAKA